MKDGRTRREIAWTANQQTLPLQRRGLMRNSLCPQLGSYGDFRKYLRDRYEWERTHNAAVTLDTFSLALDQKPSTFKAILNGQRNLTIQNLHALASALKLTWAEREIFEALVLLCQAEGESTKEYYRRRSLQAKRRAKSGKLRLPSQKVVGRWYTPALLVYLIDGKRAAQAEDWHLSAEEAEALAQNLDVPVAELVDTVRTLIESGVVSMSNGQVHVVYDKLTRSNAHIQFLSGALAVAAKRLPAEFDKKDTLFSCYTLSLTPGKAASLFNALKEIFDDYSLSGLDGADKSAAVYQMNIQAFPLFPFPETT